MSHRATPPPCEDDTIKKQELEHLELVTKEDNISTLDLSTTVVPIETDEFGNEIVHIDQAASDRLRRKVRCPCVVREVLRWVLTGVPCPIA
jgi:hypothetical protein